MENAIIFTKDSSEKYYFYLRIEFINKNSHIDRAIASDKFDENWNCTHCCIYEDRFDVEFRTSDCLEKTFTTLEGIAKEYNVEIKGYVNSDTHQGTDFTLSPEISISKPKFKPGDFVAIGGQINRLAYVLSVMICDDPNNDKVAEYWVWEVYDYPGKIRVWHYEHDLTGIVASVE
jgi:hypothetical protein